MLVKFNVTFYAECLRFKLVHNINSHTVMHARTTKEDIGIEQQLYEIVRGKNSALSCFSCKFTEIIMIANEVIPDNLVVVR